MKLIDLRHYVEGFGFVEVPEFHGTGAFVDLELTGGRNTLFPAKPESFLFLDGSPSHALLFYGKRHDTTMKIRVIRDGGMWGATFRLEVGEEHTLRQLIFQWKPGQPPEEFVFEAQALPPFGALRT